MKSPAKQRKLKVPTISILKDEVQTTLVDLPTSSARKKVTVLPIDYGSAAQQERSKLENKYREVIEHRLDWRQLVMNANIWRLNADIRRMKADISRLNADICRLNANICQLKADNWRLKTDNCRLKADIRRMQAGICRLFANGGGL